jgi:hypothetical protein
MSNEFIMKAKKYPYLVTYLDVKELQEPRQLEQDVIMQQRGLKPLLNALHSGI